MFKKFLAVVLSAILMFSLVSCGDTTAAQLERLNAELEDYETQLSELKANKPDSTYAVKCTTCNGGEDLELCEYCNGTRSLPVPIGNSIYYSACYGCMHTPGYQDCEDCEDGYNTFDNPDYTEYIDQLGILNAYIDDIEAEISALEGSSSSGGSLIVTTNSILPTNGKTACVSCSGTGDKICTFCNGTGETVYTGYAPDYGGTGNNTYTYNRTCTTCGGDGLVNCIYCGGTGVD